MNDEMIKKLAEAIANKTILSSWWSYCLLIAVAFIGGYFGSFLSGYSRKRGEQLATKADLEDIKLQIKTTTEITEKIRNDIAHEIWRKQQTESLKREKLEEYLTLLYIAKEDLSKEMFNKLFKQNDVIDPHAESKATMIRKLYFPELQESHSIFLVQYSNFKKWMAAGMQEQLEQRRQGMQTPIISDKLMEQYTPLLNDLNASTIVIEEIASQIAEKLIS